jgi:XRE family transcriptional regulator, stress-response regulator
MEDDVGQAGSLEMRERARGLRHPVEEERLMILVRRLLGDVLRQERLRQGRTLRDVSASAQVSLGYISEIERGQKEASSECLAAICAALEVPLSAVLADVSSEIAREEAVSSRVAALSTFTGTGNGVQDLAA